MNRIVIAAAAALLSLTACGIDEAQVAGLDGVESDITQDELTTLKGRFETFVGKDGQYYFHLLAGNGQKVLASEGYATKAGAEAGIASVKANGVNEGRYLSREASNGQHYFLLTAANGSIIGMSELYVSAANAARGQASVIKVITNTVAQGDAQPLSAAKIETFKGLDAKYYFHVKALNGEIVLQSQAYASKSGATSGIASVQTNGISASRYTVLPAADGKFYFVLKAANGQVIGLSEMYATKSNAERAVESIVALFNSKP